MAVSARIRARAAARRRTLWGDDGFVFRFPDADEPPDSDSCSRRSAEVEELVVAPARRLRRSSPARFREAAGRALLLPRRRAGQRTPLWAQRKRAYDLLSVASRYPSFPILLETYRECLRDVFDLPALIELLRAIEQRKLRVARRSTRARLRRSPHRCFSATSRISSTTATRRWPSAARRRSPSIRRSCASCSAKPSCASCSTPMRLPKSKTQLQRLAQNFRARSADGIHDLLPATRRSVAPTSSPARVVCAGPARQCRPAHPRAPPARTAHCRRKAPGRRGRCRTLPRCARHSAAAGPRRCAARARRAPAA